MRSVRIKAKFRKGLLGCWSPGQGVSGITTVYDLSRFNRVGRPNDGTTAGTMTAADWVLSEGRYALDFEGTDDYLDCGSIAGIRSVSIWASVTLETGATRLFDWRATNGFSIFQQSSGDIHLRYNTSLNSVSSTVANNTWTHWVGAYDGTAVHLYKNGSHIGQGNETLNDDAGDFVIGVRGAKDLQFLDGMFDDCVVYDRELIATDVQEIYQLGRGGIFEPVPSLAVLAPAAAANNVNLLRGKLHGGLLLGGKL